MTPLENGLYDPGVHDVAIAATRPKRRYVSTAREMFLRDDLGETWHPLGTKNKWPLPYGRGMAVKPDDPGVLYAGCGETHHGLRAALGGSPPPRSGECDHMGLCHAPRRNDP